MHARRYTAREVAAAAGVHIRTVQRWHLAGNGGYKVGKWTYFTEEDVGKVLARAMLPRVLASQRGGLAGKRKRTNG